MGGCRRASAGAGAHVGVGSALGPTLRKAPRRTQKGRRGPCDPGSTCGCFSEGNRSTKSRSRRQPRVPRSPASRSRDREAAQVSMGYSRWGEGPPSPGPSLGPGAAGVPPCVRTRGPWRTLREGTPVGRRDKRRPVLMVMASGSAQAAAGDQSAAPWLPEAGWPCEQWNLETHRHPNASASAASEDGFNPGTGDSRG